MILFLSFDVFRILYYVIIDLYWNVEVSTEDLAQIFTLYIPMIAVENYTKGLVQNYYIMCTNDIAVEDSTRGSVNFFISTYLKFLEVLK